MNKIKELRAKIGAFASALERMNDNATPETALSVKVANEVFGKDLAKMQAWIEQDKARLRDIDTYLAEAEFLGLSDEEVATLEN